MSTAYTAWFEYVLPSVAGAANGLVTQAVRSAVRDFCRASLIYTDEPGAINIVAGTDTYTITPPADTEVVDFTHVEVNDVEILPRGNDWLDRNIQNWRTTATGPARAFRHPGPNQIQIVPTPSESITGGLVLTCAVRPTEGSTDCPDWIMADWREAIVAGALERLYQMPRLPWSNAALYKEHQSSFTSWCNAAAARAVKGGTREPLRSSISW